MHRGGDATQRIAARGIKVLMVLRNVNFTDLSALRGSRETNSVLAGCRRDFKHARGNHLCLWAALELDAIEDPFLEDGHSVSILPVLLGMENDMQSGDRS